MFIAGFLFLCLQSWRCIRDSVLLFKGQFVIQDTPTQCSFPAVEIYAFRWVARATRMCASLIHSYFCKSKVPGQLLKKTLLSSLEVYIIMSKTAQTRSICECASQYLILIKNPQRKVSSPVPPVWPNLLCVKANLLYVFLHKRWQVTVDILSPFYFALLLG